MNIAQLNDIFARNPAAALKSARAAQMDDWIIRKLEAGQWVLGKKRATKPVDVHTELGTKGDTTLFMVKRNGTLVHFIKQIRGESGDIVSAEPLDTTNIVEAMKIIL